MTRTARLLVTLALLVVPALVWGAGRKILAESHCPYCGMYVSKSPQAMMVIEYADGRRSITCSLRCAALDLAKNQGKPTKAVSVGDYKGKGLTDAQKATWVIVGGKSGAMTTRAKWAFESKADAEVFAKESGGTLATFQEALKAANDDLPADEKMMQERKAGQKAGAAQKP